MVPVLSGPVLKISFYKNIELILRRDHHGRFFFISNSGTSTGSACSWGTVRPVLQINH